MAIFDKSETKKAYQYDAKGVYVKDVELTWMNRSPISGTWQIPAYVTTVEPISAKDGFDRVFDGTKWSYIDADNDAEKPEKVEPTVTTLKERVVELEAEKAAMQETVDELEANKAAKEALDALTEKVTEAQGAIDALVMGEE